MAAPSVNVFADNSSPPSPHSSVWTTRSYSDQTGEQAQAPSVHIVDRNRAQSASTRVISLNAQAVCSAVLAFFSSFIYLFLATLTCFIVFLYRYALLLGLFHLDSFSIPLENLAQIIDAEAVADHDNRAAAAALICKTWETYMESIKRDVEMVSALCEAVFVLTIGVLAITSIAEEVVTKTIAFLCMFACAAGIAISFNMRRHLNNVAQLHDAARDWVRVAELHASSRSTSVSMLLAAPWAWAVWSISLFLITLLSFVWRLRHTAVAMSATQGNSALPALFHTMVRASGSSGGDSANQPASGILFLPWVSRILILFLLAVAIAHFAVTSIYFTRFGFPVPEHGMELEAASASHGNAADPVVHTSQA